MKKQALRKTVVISLIALVFLNATVLMAADSKKDNRNLNFKGTVNINAASTEELQHLYNIGPKKAERIVKYRETYSGFKEIEELKHIKGIGEKTFQVIKDNVTLTGVTTTL